MFIPLLLIGTASDGPDGTVIKSDSLNELRDLFGFWKQDKLTISSTATSGAVSSEIWGKELLIYKRSGGTITADQLYNAQVLENNTTITFCSPGVSGEYIFRYVTVPEESNLITASEIVVRNGYTVPHVFRILGTRATVTIGSLYFQSEFSGDKYNSVTITVTGNTLTINNPNDAYYYSLSYPTSGVESLVTNINADYSKSKIPIKVDYYPTISPSIPNGTYSLTGGTNGTLSVSSVLEALSILDIDDIGCILICGGISSGIASAALDYINSNSYGITYIVAGDPVSLKDLTNTQYKNYLDNLSFNSPRLFHISGWGKYDLQYGAEYWSSLSSTFASLMASHKSSPTHKKSYPNEIAPIWSQSELSSNSVQFTKFIQTGYSPFRSSPSNNENIYITKVKENIAIRVHDVLEEFIGEPVVDINTVSSIVTNALENIENVKDISHEVFITKDLITIVIYVGIYGELQNIKMSFASKRQLNG